MIQKNNYNLDQDLRSLKLLFVPKAGLLENVLGESVTIVRAHRYSYTDMFRLFALPYAPLAMAAVLIAIVGLRAFPANDVTDIANLDASIASESDAIVEMDFEQELVAANLEIDFMDLAIDN